MGGMIGSTIEPADIITGVRLVDKVAQRAALIRIEVWFANFSDTEKVDQLQASLEKCMTTRLDGSQSSVSVLGKIDRNSHAPQKLLTVVQQPQGSQAMWPKRRRTAGWPESQQYTYGT